MFLRDITVNIIKLNIIKLNIIKLNIKKLNIKNIFFITKKIWYKMFNISVMFLRNITINII
jgi:hypothetical protein